MISPALLIMFLIAFFIVSIIFRRIFKWFYLVSFFFTLALALLAFLVYLDFTSLKQFPDETNLFLLDDSGKIIVAGQVNFKQNLSRPLSQEETIQLDYYYSQKDYESIKGDYFKVLIFDKEYLLPSPEEESRSEFSNFIASIANTFSSGGEQLAISSVVEAFKQGRIKVYPETIIFKLIKVMPVEPLLGLAGQK